MEDKSASMVSSKQLIFIIIGAQFATGIFSLPRAVAGEAGEDAWIAVILGAIVPFLSIYLIERLVRRKPQMTFARMAHALFGKIIGSIFVVLFIAYLIFVTAIVVRIFAEITKLYLLPETPVKAILILVVFSVVYIGSQGAKVVGRLNEFLFYLALITVLIVFLPLGKADYTNLLPVGQAGIVNITKGALTTAYNYAGTEVLLVFYFLVNKKEKVLKAGFIGAGITAILYLFMMLVCELVYGVPILQKMLWPGLTLLKIVQIPVFERLDFIFLFLWMTMGVRPALNMGFAASLSLSQLFGMEEKYNTYAMIFIGLAMFIVALIPYDVLKTFEMSNYAGYGFYIMGIGYPLLFLTAMFMRERWSAKSV